VLLISATLVVVHIDVNAFIAPRDHDVSLRHCLIRPYITTTLLLIIIILVVILLIMMKSELDSTRTVTIPEASSRVQDWTTVALTGVGIWHILLLVLKGAS